MNIERVIYFTTFALIGASYLLSGKRELRAAAAQQRQYDAELETLVRPVLFFAMKAPVAQC
ncbi:hypothetical protein ACN28I_11770 [Archangium gephyra]|uniref:hypothetical protein n=1 Tax=Archangium gephyra TaxID=48 RepID=UPI003B821BE2